MASCSYPVVAMCLGVTLGLIASATSAFAEDVGQIKVAKGAVHLERGGQKIPAAVGAKVRQADVIVTGPDGSVGIVFLDASLLSAGPNSALAIDRFYFDSTTNQGAFDTSLKKGTLAVVSGKIAKQSPDAMRVKTPAAILGARGTDFLVRAGAPGRLSRRVAARHPIARAEPASQRRGHCIEPRRPASLAAGCAAPPPRQAAPPVPPAPEDLFVLLPAQDGQTGAVSVMHGSEQRIPRRALCDRADRGRRPARDRPLHRGGGAPHLGRCPRRSAAPARVLPALLPRGQGRADPGIRARDPADLRGDCAPASRRRSR